MGRCILLPVPSTLKSLKLLSDPTRLRILLLLEAESLSVADLQTILGMAQSRISTQLSQLKAEHLVADHRVLPRWIPSVGDLKNSSTAIKEYIGYWVYRWRGWL